MEPSGGSVRQWNEEEMKNALLYGFCLVCRTPHEVEKTYTQKGAVWDTHFELVRPCGHTEADIDRELERDL